MVCAPSKQNTGAVIVTFGPDIALVDRSRAVADQVSALLVVDNTPPGLRECWLVDECRRLGGEIVSNDANVGIGAALNQGAEWARKRGLEWLLALDQDSRLYEHSLSALNEVHTRCSFRDSVAVIGCNYQESYRNEPFWEGESPGLWGFVDAPWVITSGSLISMDLFSRIGPFRGEWFIDLIDVEYCMRARRAGFRVILTKTPLMEHAVGEPIWCEFLGRKLTTPNHSPSRHYYSSRNHVVFVCEYLLQYPKVVLELIRVRTKEMVLMLCCERQRWAKSRAIVRGVFDGILRRMGKRAGD